MDFEQISSDIYCALGLEDRIVGVKFIRSKDEFDQIEIDPMKGKLKYCVMVKKAASGSSLKAGINNFGCMGAVAALGVGNLVKRSLENYLRLGLYANQDIAKQAMEDVTKVKQNIYGVMLMPLEHFQSKPDAAIVLANSYQTMRVLQGYAYYFGVVRNVHMSGNQALCSECTATPYVHNELTISPLCSGTRYYAQWDDNQLAIGLPVSKLELIADGIIKTINSTDTDARKAEIEARAKKKNKEFYITKRTAYYY